MNNYFNNIYINDINIESFNILYQYIKDKQIQLSNEVILKILTNIFLYNRVDLLQIF